MDNLIKQKFFRFIFLLLLFHLFKEEEIINNPLIISDHPNPLILTYNDKYVLLTSGQSIVVNKETGNIEANYNFCEYSFPYVLGSTESGQKFIYSSKKFCAFTLPNIFQNYEYNTMTFSNNNKYIGYIQESEYKGNANKYKFCRCEMKKDEIIIYGKKDNNKIILTYVYQLKTYQEIQLDCSTNIEDKIVCKKLTNSYYSCAYICNGQVYLQILIYRTKVTQTTTNCELSKGLKVTMSLFISHTEVELFETDNNKRDILCAKNINTKIIECSEINYKNIELTSNYQCLYNTTVSYNFLFSYPSIDENNESCDYTSFGDEYLFCCGGSNYKKCERLDNNWGSLFTFII